MSRPSLAVVVLLVALSAVTVAGAVTQGQTGATAPVETASPGEPNYLSLGESEVRASNSTATEIDVGSAISSDSSSLQATHATLRFERAYATATTAANQTRAIRHVVDRIENESLALRDRNRQQVAAYGEGAVTAGTFLRERARIESEAAALRTTIAAIEARTDRDPTYSIPTSLSGRLSDLDASLEVLQGPVSASVAARLATGGDRQRVYVEASATGYTFAQVRNGFYVRETFLGDQWVPGEPDQFTENTSGRLAAAEQRAETLYPWVSANKFGGSTWGLGPSGIYRYRAEFQSGRLTAYLDGGTTNVFREAQERTLGSFNTTEVINRTSGSATLTVDRTFPTGPAEIGLTEAGSERAIAGTVTIGDREPIELGDDGRHWFVQPRETTWINATTGSTEITARLGGS